jgi:glycine oxidase ThiO
MGAMSRKCEILIVGGGIIGLAIALELKAQGASVTILCRDFNEAATHAAAGMLAPQAEKIPPSPMWDLCLASRSLYPAWVHKLEAITGMNAGYWACGILAPSYSEPPADRKDWLDRAQIQTIQPGLSAEISGGWWFPDDAQVDNRALAKVLWMAAQEVGIEIQTHVTVERFLSRDRSRISAIETTHGTWQADHYILATGAWTQELLPIPVFPRKGQMLSLQVPQELGVPLQQVLFGETIYLVPRQDGRIILGATSEDVGFTPGNTPLGINLLLSAAIRLYPDLQDFPIQEFWYGFRPATPDELPILGTSSYENLTFATGHYRNGILLAPITSKLIAEWILTQKAEPLLQEFHWSRFNLECA